MVRTLRALLEFIYLARRNIHTRQTIREMENALERFQKYRSIFVRTGVRPENSTPPRQHSLAHYIKSIKAFGAPNGLCSSITESKHIKAIKEPWRRSNHYNALGQMLLTNQCLDKLAASCTDFARCGMLKGACLGKALKRLGWLPRLPLYRYLTFVPILRSFVGKKLWGHPEQSITSRFALRCDTVITGLTGVSR